MRIQHLVKFYQYVLKILRGNEIMTDGLMDGQNDGQPKSSIPPPTFFKTGNDRLQCQIAIHIQKLG